jgi:hypothetical protein
MTNTQFLTENDPDTGGYFVFLFGALLVELVVVYKLRPFDKYKSRAVGTCLITTLLLCALCASNMRQVVLLEWVGMNLTLILSAAFHALSTNAKQKAFAIDEKYPLL